MSKPGVLFCFCRIWSWEWMQLETTRSRPVRRTFPLGASSAPKWPWWRVLPSVFVILFVWVCFLKLPSARPWCRLVQSELKYSFVFYLLSVCQSDEMVAVFVSFATVDVFWNCLNVLERFWKDISLLAEYVLSWRQPTSIAQLRKHCKMSISNFFSHKLSSDGVKRVFDRFPKHFVRHNKPGIWNTVAAKWSQVLFCLFCPLCSYFLLPCLTEYADICECKILKKTDCVELTFLLLRLVFYFGRF